jgi:hypothetical protein
VKFRRLLLAALLAICFDVAVPLEPSIHGGLVWEDDEEEAVRADKRREAPGTRQLAPSPRREAVAARARLIARRRTARPARRVRIARVVHLAAPPPHPSPTEDH